MPPSELIFFQETDGSVPFFAWFDRLPARAQDKCAAKLERLESLGHELRRPEADFLRDGVYELRARMGTVHYRVLYFFSGRNVVVVSHGLAKEGVVPPAEIDRAVRRKQSFEASPARHAYRKER